MAGPCCGFCFWQLLVQEVSRGWTADEGDWVCQSYGLVFSLLLGCGGDITQMERRQSSAWLCLVISAPCLGDADKTFSTEICPSIQTSSDTSKRGGPKALVQSLGSLEQRLVQDFINQTGFLGSQGWQAT